VVIDDPDQIDLVHAFEVEREDVDLPHGVGCRTLEAAHLGRAFVGHRGRITYTGGIDCLAHLLGTDSESVFQTQFVADTAHPVVRMLTTVSDDPFLQLRALFADRNTGRLSTQARKALVTMDLHPLADGGGFDTEDLGYILLIGSRVDSFDSQDFGFEGNRRTAMDLLLGRYCFSRVRGPGFPFLGLGWLPE
jgi:hypothetical protein